MGVGICVVNNPHDLQWSPFEENLLAVSCRNRPGHTPISGVLYTLEFMPVNDIEIRDQVQLNVGLDLLAWSERDSGTVAASCEDGTLRFFDLHNEASVMAAQWFLGGYAADDGKHATSSSSAARSLQWDRISLEMVLTANAGHHSVDVHSVNTNSSSSSSSNADLGEQGDLEPHVLLHCDAHEAAVMDARWDTSSPFCFMSCDQAGYVYLWDMRQYNSRRERHAMRFRVHNSTCAMRMDQNLYDEHSVALGCFNQSLMTYDLRATQRPKAHVRNAHYSLVTDVQWSPHTQHLVATCSTDRTLRIWDMRSSASASVSALESGETTTTTTTMEQIESSSGRSGYAPNDSSGDDGGDGDDEEEMRVIDHTYGGAVSSFKSQKMEDWVNALDWNVHEVGLIALCCNDQLVKAYNVRED